MTTVKETVENLNIEPAKAEETGWEMFREWTEDRLAALFEERCREIIPTDRIAAEKAAFRWSKVAKPLGSLGVLEDDIIRIAGMTGSAAVRIDKKALVIFCSDNGVVEEGVTQAGQEVTAAVTANFTRGDSCACLMAEKAGADVFPVDIGVACEIGETGEAHPLTDRKIRRGTSNFVKEPAMTGREVLLAVLAGIDMVRNLKDKGYQIIATGEMGIGNTTTSSAVASVLLGADPAEVTGRGAGLSSEGLERKILAIRKGLGLHRPDPENGLDVLAKVGGFDLAGLAGVFLGGAIYHIPVIIDGFISAAAAAAAVAIRRTAADYMLAAHVSAEPAGRRMLGFLGKKPAIEAGMCLGEGTGAVALFPLLDMTLAVYEKMCTFSDMEIEEYKPL